MNSQQMSLCMQLSCAFLACKIYRLFHVKSDTFEPKRHILIKLVCLFSRKAEPHTSICMDLALTLRVKWTKKVLIEGRTLQPGSHADGCYQMVRRTIQSRENKMEYRGLCQYKTRFVEKTPFSLTLF